MDMLVSFFREVELEGNRLVSRTRPYWAAFWVDFIDALVLLVLLTVYVMAMKCVESPVFEALFSTGFLLAIGLLTRRWIASGRTGRRRGLRD